MRPPSRPRPRPRGSAALVAVPVAAAALLLGAGAAHAAAGGTDSSDIGTGPTGRPAGGQSVLGGDGLGSGSEPTTSSSLPAGGLAAALLLAGAGTVVATRAMCSGRGWR
jgi:hypothetical protein